MKTIEGKMKTRFQDQVPKPGAFLVRFQDPAHLADSLEFAKKHLIEIDLMRAIAQVILLFRFDASGLPPTQEVTVPAAGKSVTVTFTPDSRGRPSFRWKGEYLSDVPGEPAKTIMTGGLLFNGREWNLHA